MLQSESTGPAIAIFMVVSEPGRALAFWFMKAAEGRESKGRPYVFELASPGTSPIVAVEQYWSAMLAGDVGMARLVWQRRGDSSMEAWAKNRPCEAALFRRALLYAAGKSHRRRGYYRKAPYSLL
eukprot:1061260-Lingulodinium_polyedra.AAC.1